MAGLLPQAPLVWVEVGLVRVVMLVRGVEAVRGQVWGGWAGGPEVWGVEGHFAQERPFLCKRYLII